MPREEACRVMISCADLAKIARDPIKTPCYPEDTAIDFSCDAQIVDPDDQPLDERVTRIVP